MSVRERVSESYDLLILISLNVACLLNHLIIYLFYCVIVALAKLF